MSRLKDINKIVTFNKILSEIRMTASFAVEVDAIAKERDADTARNRHAKVVIKHVV